jgi:N-acetylglutamate synthase-like GNAT family acetyltransferase
MNAEIIYLAERPGIINTIARWLYDEFYYLIPGKSIDYVIESLQGRLNYDKVPLSIVALNNNEILGTVSLKIDDMDICENLTPWLASLFVNKVYRDNGIGTLLVKSIQEIARHLGYEELFLYTPGASEFYRRIGWITLEELKYKSKDVVIMNYSFKSDH